MSTQNKTRHNGDPEGKRVFCTIKASSGKYVLFCCVFRTESLHYNVKCFICICHKKKKSLVAHQGLSSLKKLANSFLWNCFNSCHYLFLFYNFFFLYLFVYILPIPKDCSTMTSLIEKDSIFLFWICEQFNVVIVGEVEGLNLIKKLCSASRSTNYENYS